MKLNQLFPEALGVNYISPIDSQVGEDIVWLGVELLPGPFHEQLLDLTLQEQTMRLREGWGKGHE